MLGRVACVLDTPLKGGHCLHVHIGMSDPILPDMKIERMEEIIYMCGTMLSRTSKPLNRMNSEKIAAIIDRLKTVDEPTGSATKMHVCKWPGCLRTKPFHSLSRLRDHSRSVHMFKKHRCKDCGKNFANMCEKNRHQNRLKSQNNACAYHRENESNSNQ